MNSERKSIFPATEFLHKELEENACAGLSSEMVPLETGEYSGWLLAQYELFCWHIQGVCVCRVESTHCEQSTLSEQSIL